MAGIAKPNSLISRALRLAKWVTRFVSCPTGRCPRSASASPTCAAVWKSRPAQFAVALCGDLGFTRAPWTVFQAASVVATRPEYPLRALQMGVGCAELKTFQLGENVILLDPMPEDQLAEVLAAADA
ncbi:hypothetical protein [Bradyrhizobium sp. USDA 4486]